MIKRLAGLSVFLLLTACAAMNGQPPAETKTTTVINAPAAPNANTVKVALLLPLSGPHAQLGQAMLQSAQLALFDVGQTTLQLLPRDVGTAPDGAAQAADAAVKDGAQLILGPIFAPDVRAAAPVAARAGVSLVAFSTDATLAGGNSYIFGFVPQEQVQRVVDYSVQQGSRRIAVLAAEGDYGSAVVAAFDKAAAHDNVVAVRTVRLPASHAQMANAVAAFAKEAAGADAVLIAADGEQAKDVASLLTQDGLPPAKLRRLGTGLWDDPALAADGDLQGAWFAAPSPDLRRGFESRYLDTYGQKPPRLATLAYDATALAAVLARRNGEHPFGRAGIANANGFAGIDGVFRFPGDNVAQRGLAVLTFRDRAIAVQDPAPQTFQAQNSVSTQSSLSK